MVMFYRWLMCLLAQVVDYYVSVSMDMLLSLFVGFLVCNTWIILCRIVLDRTVGEWLDKG